MALVCVAGCARTEPPPAVVAPVPAAATAPVWFEDVTESSGVSFRYRNGEEAKEYAILETLGGGVALLDYDGDGLLDIFLPGGGYFENKEVRGHPCALYRNLGGMKFQDVTAAAGLGDLRFYTHGCAVADFDRDGWPDLLVTGWGRVALFHNESDGKGGRRFVDVTAKAGLDDNLWSTSAAWADLDGDGWPDLYVCHYVDWYPEKGKNECIGFDGKRRDICPPATYPARPHVLYRNQGDGTFRRAGPESGIRVDNPDGDFGKGLGVVACDFNGDGKPDLYIANDTTGNFLYLNETTSGTLRLKECGLTAGVARDAESNPHGSMGVAIGDFERTGRPAIWVTNYEYEMHALYRLAGKAGQPVFQHVSTRAGIGALGSTYVGWGTAFVDFDRDGWEDIVFVNGHPNYFPAAGGLKAQLPILLRNQRDGKFKRVGDEAGAYFAQRHHGRGLALGDLDNDGQPDLVISHLNEPVTILHGIPPPGTHWLGLEFVGKQHRPIVGAKVTIEAGGRQQTKFVVGGGSYLSASDPRLLVGLGAEAKIDRVSVFWPWGQMKTWRDLAADRYVRLEE